MDSNSLRDIIKQEYKKCAQDAVYFFKKYGTIQHPDRGRISFNLYKFQERTLSELMNHRYNIILKSRQLGISTLTAAYALWIMLFNGDKSILIIATTQDIAKTVIDKVQFMYDCLPSWLKVPTVEDNKLSIRFSNGSKIEAVSSASTASRSKSISLLIIDECVGPDTKITVRNKKTGKIREILISDLLKNEYF